MVSTAAAVISVAVFTIGPVGAMEPEDFDDYVWGRAGDGHLTHRVSVGNAYDMTTGDLVARLEGHEVAIAVPSVSEPGTIFHIARAFLLYRDPQSGAVLAAYPGSDPQALTAVSAYSFDDGFRWHLGSPNDDASPRLIPGTVDCERQGPMLFCERASVYNREEGMTILEYRWTVDRTAPSVEAAARVEFAEIEPPEPGKGVSDSPLLIRLTSYRVAAWSNVPASVRSWIEEEAPGFASLPGDLDALIEAAGFSR